MSIFDNVLSWVIFGSVIGSIMYIFEPQHLRNNQPIVLGIIGALFTGFIVNLLLNIPVTQFSLISLIVALCGACFFVIGSKTLKNL